MTPPAVPDRVHILRCLVGARNFAHVDVGSSVGCRALCQCPCQGPRRDLPLLVLWLVRVLYLGSSGSEVSTVFYGPRALWYARAGLVDESRVAVAGGSHGGLLTGHLVGQHPGRFRAGALRNPVMDVSLMIHVSDIPDWCYCEGWGAEVRRRAHG